MRLLLLLLLLPLLFLCSSAGGGAQETAAHEPELGFQNGDEWVPLRVDGSRLGVRFDGALDEPAVRERIAAMPGLFAGEHENAPMLLGRTVVLRTAPDTGAAEALALCETIRAMEGVISASPRLLARDDPYYLTERVLVRWKPSAERAQIAELSAGLEEVGLLEYATNAGRVYRVPHGGNSLEIANRIAASGAVLFALPNFEIRRVTYGGATNDPLFPQQWHLETTGQMGTVPDADIDVQGAWPITRGSPDVTICVIDTGVELGHPDLAPNLVQGTDVLEDDDNPTAQDYWFGLFQERHSTAVCGVASAAGDNGIGVSGVAQNCKIMPIRFLSEFFLLNPTIQDEADAFNFARINGADVVNCSWGPVGSAPLPASTRAAIDDCNDFGRGGLGMVVFFAAGNSGADNSGNGYATYAGVVSVTSVTDQEVRASYSSFGSTVDVCAPSNGGVNGITTTDRLGNAGYSNGDYTDAFGGTSSASPCAAGVMLLILSTDPTLKRGDAIDILLDTAEVVDPAGGAYGPDGHSIYYGYGRVNAEAAVLAAAGGAGCTVASYCVTSPNSNGSGALMGSSGSTSVAANDLVLLASGASSSQPGIFFYGSAQTQVPFGEGVRCVGGTTVRLPVVSTDPSGAASFALDVTDPPLPAGEISAGETWYFQFWYRDPAGGGTGFNLSDALEAAFCD